MCKLPVGLLGETGLAKPEGQEVAGNMRVITKQNSRTRQNRMGHPGKVTLKRRLGGLGEQLIFSAPMHPPASP
jgi:hypothetical protein